MTAPFGSRLADAVAARGPLCVGIDPHPPLLERWGLPDSPEGLARFTDAVVDALAGSVAVLKPQAAFYERHGSRGLAVLEDGVARARAAGALVLLDAKRGDIDSTMAAYADYLRPDHPLAVDAMTVSPFLGAGSLQPAVDTARAHGEGCSSWRGPPTRTPAPSSWSDRRRSRSASSTPWRAGTRRPRAARSASSSAPR